MSSIGSPPKVSKHELTGDKVKIVQPLYDAEADMSQETVGFISLGWDTYEWSFSYNYKETLPSVKCLTKT